MGKKLTDEEIVKALECCDREEVDCKNCPYYKKNMICAHTRCSDTLDLIHRLKEENAEQKAEIERLTGENEKLSIKVWNYEQPARTPLYSNESMVNCNFVTCYNENADLKAKNAELQKQVDELKSKEIPKKVECHIKLPKDRIAGYCPTCNGTVDIKLTWLVKHKGHRCSWCGQAIDLTGVEVE